MRSYTLEHTKFPTGFQEDGDDGPEAPPTANPAGIRTMSFQDSINYMWAELDKPNRMEWGDGFTLDMGGKCPYQGEGQMPKDKSPNPLFECAASATAPSSLIMILSAD